MEYNNVSKLKNDISGVLRKLGVNQELRETPAYDIVLNEIGNMLESMGISEKEGEHIEVTQESRYISFSCSKGIERFEFEMYYGRYSERDGFRDKIRCTCTRSRVFLNEASNYYHKDMKVDEIQLTMVETGECVINHSSGYVDNKEGSLDQCRKRAKGSVAYFDETGIEWDRTEVMFRDKEMPYGFESLVPSSALSHIERMPFIENDKVSHFVQAVRDDINIARVNVTDYQNNSEYSSFLPLDPENGLSYLVWPPKKCPEQVDFPELTTEQIEDMIQKEKHPKAREGLRKMAANMHGYSR